jgi:hypothetical protein
MNDLEVVNSNGDIQTLNEGLNFEMEKMAKAAHKAGKKTSVTFTLEFKPGRHNEMKILGVLGTKEPKVEALEYSAYTDSRGRLFNDDPKQEKLPLDNVEEIYG